MVRIIGNSTERVKIRDLGDVIYYKQIKDFTDEEYEQSLDLKRAIRQGKIAKIEEKKTFRSSSDISENIQESITIRDLKTVLRELLPQKNNGSSDLTQAIREIAPMIADMVRQEMSKITITGIQPSTSIKSDFKGPEYIPDVDTSGMISNIEAEKRKVSVDDVDDNLAALRKLQQKNLNPNKED